MTDDLLQDARHRMEGAISSLDEELTGYRTGRASTALVERLHADYYGTPTPLNQMATISAPEPRTILIRPWDRAALGKIEKAIQASDLGLTPNNDGEAIRLNFPPLTEERREEMVRQVARRVEEARVAIRNVRRDVLHALDREDLPDDERFKAKEAIQHLTDELVAQADAHGKRKSDELHEV